MSDDATAGAPPSGLVRGRPSREGIVLLASLTLFWGVNWPAMKLAVAGIDPWTFRVLCLAVGAAGLLGWARATGHRLSIPAADRGPLVLASLFNVTGWHLGTAFGLLFMGAGRASIIAFTMPVWASLFGMLFLGERLTRARIAGLALGIAGLGVLLVPELGRIGASPWGALFMLGAAASWAGGTVAVKARRWSLETAALSGWQLVLGGIPVLVGFLLLGRPGTLLTAPWDSLLGALYAMLIPMIYCYWAWFRIVAIFPANLAAIGTLAIPVIGVFSSALVTGERVGPGEVAGLLLVVAALALVLIVPARKA